MTTETIQFSVWSHCKAKKPVGEWNIQQLQDAIKTGAGDGVRTFKDTIHELRKAKSKEEKKAIKDSRLPAVTISGTFDERNTKGLKEHSGLVQIDIDHHPNPVDLREKLANDDYVALCFISPSGNGVKAVVKVNPHPDTHLAQYNALATYFKKDFSVDIDLKCKDIPRLMFLSWDQDVYLNAKADVFAELEEPITTNKPTPPEKPQPTYKLAHSPRMVREGNNRELIEQITSIIEHEHLDITADYNRWWKLAFALHTELGAEGRVYFRRISQFYRGYKPQECDKQFAYASANNDNRITIGTIIYYAKEHGINIPQYSSAHNTAIVEKSPAASKSKQKTSRAKRIIQHDDDELYYALKNWRLRQATNEGKKAFQIFHNRTLLDVVSKQPQSLDELSNCHGIGSQKLKDYGKDILSVVKKHS